MQRERDDEQDREPKTRQRDAERGDAGDRGIEAVFAIPGAGSLVAYSAINKDFPVVQGVVLVFVVMVIVINMVVDIVGALLDPRAVQE